MTTEVYKLTWLQSGWVNYADKLFSDIDAVKAAVLSRQSHDLDGGGKLVSRIPKQGFDFIVKSASTEDLENLFQEVNVEGI